MKKILMTESAPAPVGPYSQAVWHKDTLYCSGQIAIDPETGLLITSNIEEETNQVMKNIRAMLVEAGLNFEDVLKCTIFVKDISQYDQINSIYASYFNEETAPARELVQVAALPKNVNIEISVIAGR